MPRKPRIHYPGAVYHVMLRGNAGQDIFFESPDRFRFFLLLQRAVERYGCRVHAYCLMDNHLHLAIQVGDNPLSIIMQNISFRYTQYVNRKLKRSGHLFQGRYKALLIDENSYLLELVRYIHLNPCRAGMVETLHEYPWSSHHGYAGENNTPWLTTDWVLLQFGSNEADAKRQYVEYVRAGSAEGHRKEFHSGSHEGRVLGDDHFAEQALMGSKERSAPAITIDMILDAVCNAYEISRSALVAPGRRQLFAEARAVASWIVRQDKSLQLTELSAALRRDISSLSKAANRVEEGGVSEAKMKKVAERMNVDPVSNSVSQA